MLQLFAVVGILVGLAYLFPALIPGVIDLLDVVSTAVANTLGWSFGILTLLLTLTLTFAMIGLTTITIVTGVLTLIAGIVCLTLIATLCKGAALAITLTFGNPIRGQGHASVTNLYEFLREQLVAWLIITLALVVMAALQSTFPTTSILNWMSVMLFMAIALTAFFSKYAQGTFAVISATCSVLLAALLVWNMFSSTQTAQVAIRKGSAIQQGWVSTNMSNGKSYFLTTRATKAIICSCSEGEKGKVSVHGLYSRQNVDNGVLFEAISSTALPTEANGYPMIAVHPPIDRNDLTAGWNQSVTVLVPQTDVVSQDSPRPTAPPTPVTLVSSSSPAPTHYASVPRYKPSPAPVAVPSQSFAATIPVDCETCDTGIDIPDNSQVSITATGSYVWDSTVPEGTVGPNGTSYPCTNVSHPEEFPDPSARCAELLGEVQEKGFKIGTHADQYIAKGGRLYVRVNDRRGYYADNNGSVRLTVVIH